MRCAGASLVLFLLVQPLFADYLVFYENGKAGLRDEAGNVLIPAAYDALGWSDGSFSVVNNVTGYRRNSRWGLINLKKELVTQADYENLQSGGGDRIVASRWLNPYTKKFGCIDLYGNVTVPFHYDAISILGLRAVVCVKNGARYEYGVIDLDDKTILKTTYRDIRPVGSLRFAVQNFERKTALFSEEGAALTDFVIDSISTFREGYALIYENVKVGLLDRFGEIVASPAYREIKIDDDGTITGMAFPIWREVDAKNVEVRKILADGISPEGKYYRISLSGLQGTVDAELNSVIEPRYEYLEPFTNNMAVAAKDGKRGVIRFDGKTIIPFEHDSLSIQSDLLRSLQVNMGQHCWAVYDTFGIKKTERCYEYLGKYNGRYFPARRNGYWGAIDRYGKELADCVYDSIFNFSHEHIAVKFKGLYGIVDYTEKWLVMPQRNPVDLVNDNLYFEREDSILFVKDFAGQIIYFTNNQLTLVEDGFIEVTPEGSVKFITWQGISTFELAPPVVDDTEKVFEDSEGYRGVQRDGRFGFIDSRGRLRIANRYDGIGKFKEGLAPVKIRSRWGYVNTEDQIVINPLYDHASEFDHGVSVVTRNGMQGLLSIDGKVLLSLRYDSITHEGDKLLIFAKGKVGLANRSGHVLIEPRFRKLEIADTDLVLVSDGELWGALTNDGMSVIPMMYGALRYNKVTGQLLAKENKGWEKLSPTRR